MSLKIWRDLMPINVTITNSGKISLQETIKKILVFTLANRRKLSIFFVKIHSGPIEL